LGARSAIVKGAVGIAGSAVRELVDCGISMDDDDKTRVRMREWEEKIRGGKKGERK
jgi:hypothetical protein